ncbi:hypothetical protein GQ457_04G032090 [Hibiscus cannabinus]
MHITKLECSFCKQNQSQCYVDVTSVANRVKTTGITGFGNSVKTRECQNTKAPMPSCLFEIPTFPCHSSSLLSSPSRDINESYLLFLICENLSNVG